ncbi:COG0702 Predicted nucleoside-diphosphate-sugar epimerases [Candidatus Methylopumilus universalis]|uniref:complex I NDUFA9 subunit family protein n=1 Tax=Candidatus Methylopumilus universalis TaxID=2588536 RepID=UPI003BEEEB9B
MTKSKKTIAIFGASGFLGSSIVLALSQSNHNLKLFSRNKEKIKLWTVNPHVQIFNLDLNNLTQIKKDLKKTDVIINLLGILHQTKKESFDNIHHIWPSRLAKVMKDLGIKRLLHVSALGASVKAPSLYLKSKALGESELLKQIDLDLTILRPSIIFGAKDNFINMFKILVKWLPAIVLLSPNSKFQPIFIDDVSKILIKTLFDKTTYGKMYDLGGPDVYSLKDIIRLIIRSEKLTRIIIPLNRSLSYLFAFIMEMMPIKILTRDNWRSMEVDNVVNTQREIYHRYSLERLEHYLSSKKSISPVRSKYDFYRTKSGR